MTTVSPPPQAPTPCCSHTRLYFYIIKEAGVTFRISGYPKSTLFLLVGSKQVKVVDRADAAMMLQGADSQAPPSCLVPGLSRVSASVL